MNKRELTIDHSLIDIPLSDYPVMVKFDENNFDFSKIRVDGLDLKFTDMAENLLDFEVEYFSNVDTTNTLVVYDAGNEFTEITGGWEVARTNGNAVPTLSKNPSSLAVKFPEWSDGQLKTINSIDLSKYETIGVEWTRSGTTSYMLFKIGIDVVISAGNILMPSPSIGNINEGVGPVSLWFGNTFTHTINISKIWLTPKKSKAVYHVRIPHISDMEDTSFICRYGDDSDIDLSNSIGVWDDNFVMVQHMGESLIDSTGKGNDGVNNNSIVIDTLNGKARQFTPNQKITFPDSNYLDLTTALSLTILLDYTTTTNCTCLEKSPDNSNYQLQIMTGGLMEYRPSTIRGPQSIALADGITRLFNGTHENNSAKLYVNHELVSAVSLSLAASNNWPLILGTRHNVSNIGFSGNVHELRISNIARSAEWIKADDANLRTNTLLTIGPEEPTVELDSISITSFPDKLLYYVDQPLDLTGLVVMRIFVDDTTKEIEVTSNMVSGFNSSLAVESQIITITYLNKITTFTITIINPTLLKLRVIKLPIMSNYKINESLDYTGLEVVGDWNDEVTRPVILMPEMISGFDSSSPGQKKIKILKNGVHTTFTVLILDPIPINNKHIGQKLILQFDDDILDPPFSANFNINIAKNKIATSNKTLTNKQYLTDENTATEPYVDGGQGLAYVQIDLGELVMVGAVHVWHYYSDARIYNSTKTEISVDGVTWISIFDSSITGVYSETASGKLHTIPKAIEGRYIRDWLNGSNKNTGNHWVELKVFKSDFSYNTTGFSITGEEYKYINGPLITKEYNILSATKSEDENIKNQIVLTFHPQSRFNNIIGFLNIKYTQAIGNLQGRGGFIEDFEQLFLPMELFQKNNPHTQDNLVTFATSIITMNKVLYNNAYTKEQINISATASIELIDTNIVNP